jgi:NAD(P)-dependent dehydrogenase (short-subunit alcohol dehydrogenase family)
MLTDTAAESDVDAGKLTGMVALVTGGGRGIGRGIAVALAKAGADVVVAGRTSTTLEDVQSEVTALGRACTTVVCDIADPMQIDAMVKRAIDVHGRLNVVVNNAQGWGPPGSQLSAPPRLPPEELPIEWWDNTFRTGVTATFLTCRAAFPHLKASEGAIINFGSSAGVRGSPNTLDYAANKEAIRGLTRSLARAWGQHGINVNVICPVIATTALLAQFEGEPEALAVLRGQPAMRRLGEPERDAGALAVFLASRDSSYITGQTFMLDGGIHMF